MTQQIHMYVNRFLYESIYSRLWSTMRGLLRMYLLYRPKQMCSDTEFLLLSRLQVGSVSANLCTVLMYACHWMWSELAANLMYTFDFVKSWPFGDKRDVPYPGVIWREDHTQNKQELPEFTCTQSDSTHTFKHRQGAECPITAAYHVHTFLKQC